MSLKKNASPDTGLRAKNLEISDTPPRHPQDIPPKFKDGSLDFSHHLPSEIRDRGVTLRIHPAGEGTLYGGAPDPYIQGYIQKPPGSVNRGGGAFIPFMAHRDTGELLLQTPEWYKKNPLLTSAIQNATKQYLGTKTPTAPIETLDDTARFRNLEVSEKKLLAKELLSKLAKSLKKEVKANWLNKPILDEKHIPELEQKAAFYQLHDDLPREEAEKKTYAEYTKAQRAQAGLHHLKAAKMALLAGDPETARKHGLLYQLHNKALGAEGIGPAHPDIVALSGQKPEKKHPFKTHDADIFISDLEKAEKSEKRSQTTCYCRAYLFPHRFKSHPGCPGTPTPKQK